MTQMDGTEPAATVTGFLRDLEAGNIAAATARTAPGFSMQFPGGMTFTTFDALFEWARQRYTGIRKTFERIDAAVEGDSAIVHVSGTLSGRWLDGEDFSGIRYLDRFDLRRGLITHQTVWNDMGETRLRRLQAHGAAISPADSTNSAPGGSGASAE